MHFAGPANATMVKFGYPDTLVKAYACWLVLLRPGQVTLGSLVLACTAEATAFSQIGADAFLELETVSRDIETCLGELWSYDKINYLMLMMVDLDVHFHVIPRYAGERAFGDRVFRDTGWPGPPDLGRAEALDDGARGDLVTLLGRRWPA